MSMVILEMKLMFIIYQMKTIFMNYTDKSKEIREDGLG